MHHVRHFLLAAAVLVLSAVTATAAPAPPPGKNIPLPYPAKAPIVATINGLERSRERLTKMLAALPPADADSVRKQLDGGLEALLADRKLTAVPKEGRLFVVLHDITTLGNDEPAISVLVPVTSYKEFRDSFLTPDERKSFDQGKDGIDTVKTSAFGDERALYMVDRKDYVVITPEKATAEIYTGKFTPAMSGGMGPDLSGSFLTSDIALYVNMDVINDLYGDQIRQFKGLIDFALMQAQGGGMLPGLNKKQLEVAKVMLQGVFQAAEDARGILVGLEFRPEGLNVRAQARFSEDSPSGRMLKPETPTPLADIAKLPKGMTFYSGSKFSKKFTDLLRQFSMEFTGPDDDDAANEQLTKMLAEIAAAGPLGDYTTTSPPETTFTVSGYREPSKAAASYAKLYKSLPVGSRVNGVVLKEKPRVTEKAQSHQGFEFTEVQIVLDFEATVKDLPDNVRETTLENLKRSTKEKSTFWIGTDGKMVVQVNAKDWAAAKAILDAYLDGKSPLGSDAGYQFTRKSLPTDANLIYVFETGKLIELALEQARSAGGMIPGFPKIGNVKPVKGEAAYIAVALTLKPEIVTLDLFVPGTAMNVAARTLAPLFRTID